MKTWADYNITFTGHGETRTVCPECSHSRNKTNDRCLAVNTDKETWLCHHCGWSGGLGKAVEYVRVAPITTDYKKPVFNKTVLPIEVVNYFNKRGISRKTLDDNSINHGETFIPGAGKKVSAIQFPYFINGEVVNIKHRDSNKNFAMEKGAERVLYGFDDIDEISTIIVEGEIDKLSLYEAGMKHCVSVPDGAPSENTKNYSTKFNFLESAESKLADVHRFVIAVDSDAPGARLKSELIRRLGAWRCWVAVWPDDCKDANDVLVKYSPQKLIDCIADAQPVPVDGIYSVNDFKSKLLDSYEYGFKPGEKTGWQEVDKYYSVRPGEFTIVTGIPGSGKSEWLDALMVNLADDKGWVFGVLSMENLPLERHFAKLAEKYVNMPFEDKMMMGKMARKGLDRAIKWGQEHFKFLVPDDSNLTVDGVLNLAKTLVYRYGITGLVIDPWNELNHVREQNVTETEHISQSLGKIRRFARENEIHIWVVAHPTKLIKNKDDGKYPVPTPYDIAGSAHWRNKADNAITVHRPNMGADGDREVNVHVQKIRFKEIGRLGMATLKYDIVTGRYNE